MEEQHKSYPGMGHQQGFPAKLVSQGNLKVHGLGLMLEKKIPPLPGLQPESRQHDSLPRVHGTVFAQVPGPTRKVRIGTSMRSDREIMEN
jgi:hypothetical protein